MKKILCAMLLMCAAWSCAWAEVAINAANFPDEAFREYVSKNFDKSDPKDGILSDAEIAAAVSVSVSSSKIESLQGIEHFTALQELTVKSSNKSSKITALALGKNTALQKLEVNASNIESLILGANTALQELTVTAPKITSLDLDANTALQKLNVKASNIKELILGKNTELRELTVYAPKITKLELGANTKLRTLNCSGTKRGKGTSVEELDLRANTELQELNCSYNDNLTTLKLSGLSSLVSLDCSFCPKLSSLVTNDNTKLEYLNFSGATYRDSSLSPITLDLSDNKALKSFVCKGNPRVEAINLRDNTKLEYLNWSYHWGIALDISENKELKELVCNNNDLEKLDITQHDKLTVLDCSSNSLKKLELSGNPALTNLNCSDNNLTSLILAGHSALKDLNCGNNSIESLDISGCKNLETLKCTANGLKELYFGDLTSLIEIECSSNRLRTLNTTGLNLEVLICDNNFISSLNLSTSTNLYQLNCANNMLTKLELNLDEGTQCRVSCEENQLTEFDGSLYLRVVSEDDEGEIWYEATQSLTFESANGDSLADESNDIIPIKQSVPTLSVRRVSEDAAYPYQLDLRNYVSESGLSGIISESVKAFNENNSAIEISYSEGIVKFASAPSKVVYRYDTGLPFDSEYEFDDETGEVTSPKNYIFEVTIGGLVSDTVAMNGHVYRIFNQSMTWEQAKEYCELLGGHLMTVNSDDERKVLTELLAKERVAGNYDYYAYWLGAYRDEDPEDVDNGYENEEDIDNGRSEIHYDDSSLWHWITGENFTLDVISNFDEDGNFKYESLDIYYRRPNGEEEEYSSVLDIDETETGSYRLQAAFTGVFVGIHKNVMRGFICEWDSVQGNFADYSDEYKRYLENPDEYESKGGEPEPTDLSRLIDNLPKDSGLTVDLPPKFDPRGVRPLPAVKNQYINYPNKEKYDTCWAFASISALEASYLAQGFGTTAPDLSELHLAWYFYKDPRYGYEAMHGGKKKSPGKEVLNWRAKLSDAVTFISRAGVTLDSEMPYVTMAGKIESNPPTKYEYPEDYPHPLRLKGVYSLGAVEAKDRDIVKGLIYDYGAVAITYQHTNSGENTSKTTYYYKTDAGYGHAVIIVGWYDDYPRANFKNDPGENGAWLAINSEGTSYGENGFFWISYQQKIDYSAVLIAAQDSVISRYGNNSAAPTTVSSEYNWAARIFQANRKEKLNEVAFQTGDHNVNYAIYVNKHGNTKPDKSQLIEGGKPNTVGTADYYGYHSIPLTTPVEVDEGEFFSVLIELTGEGSYAQPATDVSSFRSAGLITNAGDNFFAAAESTPKPKDWVDGENLKHETCIEVFSVSYGPKPPSVAPKITTSSLPNGTAGKSYSTTLSASGSTPISWTVTGLPGGLSCNGNVISGTPAGAGKYRVSVTAKNSAGTDSKIFDLTITETGRPDPVVITPSISTSSLPDGTVGKSYRATLKASGSNPISWTVTGLPGGLSCKGNVISGTPTEAGNYSVLVTAKNGAGTTSKRLDLTIKQTEDNPGPGSKPDDQSSGGGGGGGGGCNSGYAALMMLLGFALYRKH